jgi:RimJ/RimL family protein N-acetyltransferase
VSAVKQLLGKLRHQLEVRREVFFEVTDPSEILRVPAKIPVDFVRVTPENVERVADFREPALIAWCRGRLGEGQYGIFALAGGRVVGHVWAVLCQAERCLANGYIEIASDEAALHAGRVAESQRGQRIFQAMLAEICVRLFDEMKVRRIATSCELDNPAARHGHEKVGFKPTECWMCVLVHRRLIYRRRLAAEATA